MLVIINIKNKQELGRGLTLNSALVNAAENLNTNVNNLIRQYKMDVKIDMTSTKLTLP